jgi:hypothetical protein
VGPGANNSSALIADELQSFAMANKEDEARVGRIRAVIDALHAKASNSPGVKEEYIPAALVAFFVDEFREQVAEAVKQLKKQNP